jgi:post-segregation antitoxin (ccd killing protein)
MNEEIIMEKKTLEELAKELRKEYKRRWNRENRDKVRESNRQYWLRKAEKALKERENNNNK